MATEEASPVRFSVNGSTEQLRLVVENPDDDWYADNVGVTGILYKAEAGGDYSYRGDDPDGVRGRLRRRGQHHRITTDEYAPLIAFLKWLNESDDADLCRRARPVSRHPFLRRLSRDPGPGPELRRHRRTRQQLLPELRRVHRPVHGHLVGPEPRVRRPRRRHATFAACPVADDLPPVPSRRRRRPHGRRPARTPGAGRRDRVDPAYRRRSAPGDGRADSSADPGPDANVDGPARRRGPGMRQRLSPKVPCERGLRCHWSSRRRPTSRRRSTTAAPPQQILDAWTAVLKEQATDLVPAETIDTEAAQISEIISG